jgi:hypothetical protein
VRRTRDLLESAKELRIGAVICNRKVGDGPTERRWRDVRSMARLQPVRLPVQGFRKDTCWWRE